MNDSIDTKQLREEFNRWATNGKGESMEHEHWPITKPTLELMRIAPADSILEAGCGAGWLSRVLAQRVPEGFVVGTDISNEMIERARRASAEFKNLSFLVADVGKIPYESDSFAKVISVESSYYWPDPAAGLREIHRLLRKAGSAWILINYYRDNPHCHQWGKKLAVPTHLLWADEWAAIFRAAGFSDVSHRRIPDPTPAPEVYTGRWFRDARQLAEFRAIGALLVQGTK
jgi:ubiquinone/menaquinone biosynthesis C-methylase UbiE